MAARAMLAPLVGLDWARRALVRVLGRHARPLLVAREARVALFGCVGITVAFLVALICPAWGIGVGTVVLGVPHVVSDVRYLVVRRGLTRRVSLHVAVLVSVVGTLLGYGLRSALAGAAIAVLFARASAPRRGLVLGGLAGLFALAWVAEWRADLVYLQAHNLIAVGFFALFVRRSARLAWLPLAAFAVLGAFLLSPYALTALGWTGAFSRAPAGMDLGTLASQIAPTAAPSWAVRGVAFFAFAQASHYVVWLRLVPELDRPTPRPRSFRQSVRTLVRELSPYLVVAFLIGTLVFAVWALRDLAGARIAYLQSAFFHGYLELAVIALFAAEGLPTPGAPAVTPEAEREAAAALVVAERA